MTRCAHVLLALLATGCATEYEGVDLFPLYRDVGDEEAGEFFWLLPPVWSSWDAEGSLSWSLPLHYHRERGDHTELTFYPLLPIWYDNRTPGAHATSLFPLWQRERIGVRTATKYLLGVVGHASDSDEAGLEALTVVPLFDWRDAGTGTKLDLIGTGDILTGETGIGSLFSLIAIDRSVPRFGETDGEGLQLDVGNVFGGLVSLFHWDDASSHDELRVLTLLRSEPVALFRHRRGHLGGYDPDSGVTMLFPLWFDFHDPEERFFTFWPFYGFRERGDEVVARYFAWPLLTTRHDDATPHRGFQAVFSLFGSMTEKDVDESWCWPLFSARTSDRGHDWRVLFGLVGHAGNESRSVLYLLWIPIDTTDEPPVVEPGADGGEGA